MKPVGFDRKFSATPPSTRRPLSPALERVRSVALTWPFMASVALLLLNDFWLKQAWPGIVSGKLSDFAGIATLTMLLLATAPRHRRLIFAAMAVAFAWWKSPLSQPFIDAMNVWLPMKRVVDFPDLLALAVMPCCALVTQRPDRFSISRTVAFKVEAHADGLIFGESPQEKCAEILRDLKKLMMKIDPGLEFEENSRCPGSPPGAG